MEQGSTIVFYLFGIPVSGYITTMWFIMALLAGAGLVVTSSLQKVPGRFQALAEYTVEGLLNFFSSIMGPEKGRRYFPLCATLFLFILFSNMLGLFPGSGHFTAFHAPTSTFSCTAALAIIVFIAVQGIAIKETGLRHYLKKFVSPVPFMLPLTIIEELVKPVSLPSVFTATSTGVRRSSPCCWDCALLWHRLRSSFSIFCSASFRLWCSPP